MPESADLHGQELLRALGERRRAGSRPGRRTDGLRIALAIEGGAMRGTVSAGMALALHELGLTSAFDAVYGASAGAITGAWLLSSRPEGLRGWTEPSYASTLIRWSALLRGRPVVDVRTLIEVVYQTEFPMDFGSVLASEVEYHPLATDAITGESIDLRPLITDPAELRLALRASASLPFLAGPPVRLRGRRFYDAGIAESVPFRTPLAQGATHILVLRSRGLLPPRPVPPGPLPPGPLPPGPLPPGPIPPSPIPPRRIPPRPIPPGPIPSRPAPPDLTHPPPQSPRPTAARPALAWTPRAQTTRRTVNTCPASPRMASPCHARPARCACSPAPHCAMSHPNCARRCSPAAPAPRWTWHTSPS